MGNNLKILFTIEVYPPEINGSGIATKRIAEGLAKRGYNVGVACSGTSIEPKMTIENEVTVYRLGSLPVFIRKDYHFSPFARASMGRIFDDFRPDILHIADHFFVSTAANIEAKKRDVKVVGTNHFHPDNILHHSNMSKDNMFYRILEQKFWDSFLKVFNGIDMVTVPSNTAAKIIEHIGIEKPILVISNGLDLGNFKIKAGTGEIRKRFSIRRDCPVFVTVSRLEKEKRVDILIKALARIRGYTDFQFLIAGNGGQKKILRGLAQNLGIGHEVIFTGQLNEGDLVGLYKASDIYLSGSEVELQGLSIMEAMASGLPVIAARAMAIPELVLHGTNGLLFNPGDAEDASGKTLKLARDKKLRVKMSKNSLQLIRKHDFKNTLDKFENIYGKLANKKQLDRSAI
ncbi:MAG: glycosyltransferase [Candidatus Humimicrobiaceae bacterium]